MLSLQSCLTPLLTPLPILLTLYSLLLLFELDIIERLFLDFRT